MSEMLTAVDLLDLVSWVDAYLLDPQFNSRQTLRWAMFTWFSSSLPPSEKK